MVRRSLTIWLPLVSLAIAMILVSHDAVMAVGPHDVGEHAAHAEHRESGHDQIPVEPESQESPCGSFKAVRTDGPTRDVDPDAAITNPFVTPLAGRDPVTPLAVETDPDAPPGQLRALLQVWLI